VLNEQNVGAIFSIVLTPGIVVVGAIVVVDGYRRYHAYIVVFVFGYESWVGRLIAGAYIWAVAFVIICIFVVFAPSERLITPAGKLRHMKSDTPRRVVEVIARTLGARYSNLCHRLSHQIWIGYLGDSIQAWSGDDLRQAHRPELYREELGALSKYYGPEAGWIDGGLFCFLSSPRSDRPFQVSYSPSVQNYSFD